MTNRTPKAVLLILVILAVPSAFGQIPDWYASLKTIEPRVSSKIEIEELFLNARVGKSFVYKGTESVYYETVDGELSVLYAAGNCPDERKEICDFEKDTVLEAIFFPKRKVRFSKLKLKMQYLDFFVEDDNPTEHYVDTKAGLDHDVQRKKLLHVKVFHPSMYEQVKRSARTGNP